MSCYFLYNVPITQALLASNETSLIGATPQIIAQLAEKFRVEKAPVPAFYTEHYHVEHTPYQIIDEQIELKTYISKDRLKEIDFFRSLELEKDITVSCSFGVNLQSTGVVMIKLDVEEGVSSNPAYRLSGLHLNEKYTVIETEPIKGLWSGANESERPEFISPDNLARLIHAHFFSACDLDVRRVKALSHEIQIPFTSIEVETESETQTEFIEKNVQGLAELVFKPACWEVEEASSSHAKEILTKDRLWSVAEDAFVVLAYEGALFVKIRKFDTGVAHRVSGFSLADEESVFHSFMVASTNYHFLRILDDLLDSEMKTLNKKVKEHQEELNRLFDSPSSQSDAGVLRELNKFVIKFTRTHFQLIETLAEFDNSDKLIDEEWHIVLLDKLNAVLGSKAWRDSISNRIENMRNLVQTVENTYERLLSIRVSASVQKSNEQLLNLSEENQEVERRLSKSNFIFGILAAAELIGLMIVLLFDSANPFVVWLGEKGHLVGQTRNVVGAIIVLLLLYLMSMSIELWAGREKSDENKKGS